MEEKKGQGGSAALPVSWRLHDDVLVMVCVRKNILGKTWIAEGERITDRIFLTGFEFIHVVYNVTVDGQGDRTVGIRLQGEDIVAVSRCPVLPVQRWRRKHPVAICREFSAMEIKE